MSATRSSTALSVDLPRTTSTSFMIGAGLKKCMPQVRAGCPIRSPSSETESDDVLVAMMADSGKTSIAGVMAATLMSRSSTMASMKRSQLLRSTMTDAWSRCMSALPCSQVIRPLATLRSIRFPIPVMAAVAVAGSTSMSRTSQPAVAATCAIPAPMAPAPSIPTVGICGPTCL